MAHRGLCLGGRGRCYGLTAKPRQGGVRRGTSSALLHDMRQLMRQQPPARVTGRIVLTGAEYDAAADGIGARAYRRGGVRCRSVGVDSHTAEVFAEAAGHEGMGGPIEPAA